MVGILRKPVTRKRNHWGEVFPILLRWQRLSSDVEAAANRQRIFTAGSAGSEKDRLVVEIISAIGKSSIVGVGLRPTLTKRHSWKKI